MCETLDCGVDKQNILNELLLKAQIEGIQKEVQSLKNFYNNTVADYRFDNIRNRHEWNAEESTSLEEKL